METLLIISLFLLFVIYAGYGIAIAVYNRLNPFSRNNQTIEGFELPEVAVLVAAYNEEDVIEDKIHNTLNLDYPSSKLKMYVIGDGSTDRTNEIVSRYPEVTLIYQPIRKGKSAAINRAIPFIKESIVVFTDANVKISGSGIRELCVEYADARVGGVSGEKVVLKDERAAAASTEGMYWKYESFLKKEDAKLSSLIGAAGELFSIRTELFEPIPEDTLLDDFMISMNILRKGYRIAYAPKALAMEKPSMNIEEEYKRKVRISAGGLQSTIRTTEFFNVKKYGIVAIQYLIHRISRWTVSPILLILAFVASAFTFQNGPLFLVIFILQMMFYSAALMGWIYKENKKESRLLNIPFYFLFMHYCVVMGWIRYAKGNQQAAWQKAARLNYN